MKQLLFTLMFLVLTTTVHAKALYDVTLTDGRALKSVEMYKSRDNPGTIIIKKGGKRVEIASSMIATFYKIEEPTTPSSSQSDTYSGTESKKKQDIDYSQGNARNLFCEERERKCEASLSELDCRTIKAECRQILYDTKSTKIFLQIEPELYNIFKSYKRCLIGVHGSNDYKKYYNYSMPENMKCREKKKSEKIKLENRYKVKLIYFKGTRN